MYALVNYSREDWNFCEEISRGKIFGSPFRKWTINADWSLDGNAVKINPIDAEISFLAKYKILVFTSSLTTPDILSTERRERRRKERKPSRGGGMGGKEGGGDKSRAIDLALVKGTAWCCSCPICSLGKGCARLRVFFTLKTASRVCQFVNLRNLVDPALWQGD